MAKKEENQEQQMPEAENLQQPEDPKPKKKKGLSLPLIIVISLVALLILVGGTLGAVYIMVNNMVQNTNTEQTADSSSHSSQNKKDKLEEEGYNLDENYAYLKNIVKNQSKNIRYMEIPEIVTNPKSSGKFVILDIGIEFVAYDEEGKVMPVEEGGETDEAAFFKQNEIAKLKNIVNNVIWSRSVEELQQNRSEMPGILEKKFEPLFKKKGAVIKEIVILRFIIQGN